MKGASQHDKHGHDLSGEYDASLEHDGRVELTAYVYPARVALEVGFQEVLDVMRLAWPGLDALQQQPVTVADRHGWFAEAITPVATSGVPRTAVWLFECDGWFVKYRVSSSRRETWSDDLRREILAVMTDVGWPQATTRLASGQMAAVDASTRALADALGHAPEHRDDSATAVLAALERADLAAAEELVADAPRPLPPGFRVRVIAAALAAGEVSSAYLLDEAMRADDEESRRVGRLLCAWSDQRIRFRGGSGAYPDSAVAVDVPVDGLSAHAVHQYLHWLLGPPGHMWWIRGVAVWHTASGPREVVDIALRDGRHVAIWFDTGVTLASRGSEDFLAGTLVWTGPGSVDPQLQLDSSLDRADPVALRLADHAVQSFMAVECASLQPSGEVPPAFRSLCALEVDHALLQERYDDLEAPPPENAELVPVNFYIHHKAFRLCYLGAAVYASDDYFGLPDMAWGDERLATVMSGARQLVDWRGVSPDAPLRGLGIAGFRDLLQTLHFTLIRQSLVEMEDDWAIDAMTMRHVVDDEEVTLYNAVAVSRRTQPRSH